MAAKRSAKSRKTESRLVHEVEAILCSALGAALALSFYSYSPDSPATNQVGVVGYTVAHALVQCFGYASYLFPALLVAGAVGLFARQTATVSPVRLVGAVALLFEGAVVLGLYRQGVVPAEAGGWVGGFLSTLARQAFGMVGSSVILAAFAGWIFIMLTGAAPSRVLARFALLVRSAVLRVGNFMGEKIEQAASGLGEFVRAHRPRMPRMPRMPRRSARPVASSRREQVEEPAAPMVFSMDDEPDLDETDTGAIGFGVDEFAVDAASNGHAELDEGKARAILEITSSAESVAEARRRMSEESKGRDKQEKFNFSVDDNDYSLPPVNLLGDPDEADVDVDEDTLIALSKVLEQKLSTFGVSGSVTAVRSGPVITTYEFEPDAGIKVSRIVNLCDDLTMALRAHGVRIVAPIPGKNVVGIEVSNRHRDLVGLRDLIDCEEFRDLPSALSVVVGRDTTGVARYADLAKMPHLLMAGATGSGKSVALNAIIMSILYKATPRDVRFIMIDPKMLELSIYEGIPHLLVPVVTDVRKAAAALANVMREMDRRFELMKELKVRSIDDYNTRVAEQLEEEYEEYEEEEELETELELAEGEEYEEEEEEDEEGEEEGEDEEYELEEENPHEHLPRVVVVVDELADLMMVVGREVEESITRLAQKARAAGIHLILATQRPSVDVITGLIKANFPARISFQVTSRHDSKTILDGVGAERLLGMGDMLYMAPGTSFLARLHGAFISDREIDEVVEFIKEQGAPQYQMELLDSHSGDEEDEGEQDFYDELYDKAVDVVTRHGQGSTSWVQRQLGVGYNRAARIMEQMERDGVVGPADGSRPRQVLAPAMPPA